MLSPPLPGSAAPTSGAWAAGGLRTRSRLGRRPDLLQSSRARERIDTPPVALTASAHLRRGRRRCDPLISRSRCGPLVLGCRVTAGGNPASASRDFSGSDEFLAILPTWARRFRRRAFSASLSGARHGFAPMRKGQAGQVSAMHFLTSSTEPLQQSRQRKRSAASGVIGSCPSARNSSGFIFQGSRATDWLPALALGPSVISGGVVISIRQAISGCRASSKMSPPVRTVGTLGTQETPSSLRPKSPCDRERAPPRTT